MMSRSTEVVPGMDISVAWTWAESRARFRAIRRQTDATNGH